MSKLIKGEGEVFDPTLFEVGQQGSLVPREFLLATDEGKDLIRQARLEAARIQEQACQVLAAALQEKAEERQHGFEEGYQEGLSQVTERLAEIEVQRDKVLAAQEGEIIEMVLEIAQKVVARELKKRAIVDIVREAISQAVGDRIVVKVHPTDQEKLEDLELVQENNRTLLIEADETVTPGGCLIETELGTVDAQLETQWTAIRKALGLGRKEE